MLALLMALGTPMSLAAACPFAVAVPDQASMAGHDHHEAPDVSDDATCRMMACATAAAIPAPPGVPVVCMLPSRAVAPATKDGGPGVRAAPLVPPPRPLPA